MLGTSSKAPTGKQPIHKDVPETEASSKAVVKMTTAEKTATDETKNAAKATKPTKSPSQATKKSTSSTQPKVNINEEVHIIIAYHAFSCLRGY